MQNDMDLTRARAAAEAALTAAERDGKRISIAVVDHRGQDVLVLRGDGAPWFTAGVARAKAATAALMGAASGDLAGLRAAHPELLDLIGAQTPQPMTTLAGGVPVRLGVDVVGAIGVSGADPDEDVAFARAGIAALRAIGERSAS
ncbi:heme-binding protein [Rhodococcus sp. Q]|uniref:GlcG/HbpS family heme-binding protein n=1 Tax=Rhodococcus sp. Q TaxID=2502252 RepID=UPI0010F7D67D|nr:heme-binding protein [Rhodococcus sp. Q]